MSVVVELYGIARLRAGESQAHLEAGTLGELLAALVDRYPALSGEVIGEHGLADGWLASLDGERFVDDPGTALPDGAHLMILSSQAGG